MADIIIRANDLAKKYLIHHEHAERYTALRDVVVRGVKKIPARLGSLVKKREADAQGIEEFWALRGLSFEVAKGDRMAVIGRNGAGKSTLLKLLSRITEPSRGRIELHGRVASLLEVGTGFHPELTGRENIFLNGAILGMKRQEIRAKFDEIVAFAEVERFLDTPVKRYSSGMYVRLAFAVAAHLEPEILVVDEVLAVGDAQFQKKCLGKMENVSTNEGRTVLFVSHNMAAVSRLCNKGMVLQQGAMAFQGDVQEAIAYYQSNDNTPTRFDHVDELEKAPGNDLIRVLGFEIKPIHGDVISLSSGVRFELTFFNAKPEANIDSTFELKTVEELVVLHRGAIVSRDHDSVRGVYKVTGEIPPYILNAGTYKFKLIFGEDQKYPLFIADDFIQFEVLNEAIGNNSNQLPGFLALDIPFRTELQRTVN